MEDRDVLDRIERLVGEEHGLFEKGGHETLSDSEEARLRELEVQLDQCWDLLRQRRARREAGLDPDSAEARPVDVVETYQQ